MRLIITDKTKIIYSMYSEGEVSVHRVDRSKVENYDLGSFRYVPIDKLAITRLYLRYSITSAWAPA